MQTRKDAITNLSKGKPTKSKIGSRAVSHRLTQEEQKAFDRAKKSGVLKTKPWYSKALQNIWDLWQQTPT